MVIGSGTLGLTLFFTDIALYLEVARVGFSVTRAGIDISLG